MTTAGDTTPFGAALLVNLLVSLLGALGITSLITQYVSGSRDRRGSRAEALAALSQLEFARWAPAPAEEWHAAMRGLQTAALVARLPQEDVREYLVLAQAARWRSVESYDERGEEDMPGGIDGRLAAAAREAARAVADTAWESGIVRRLHQKRRRQRVADAVAKVERDSAKRAIRRSREYGVA